MQVLSEKVFFSLFCTSFRTFNESDLGSTILFQIKVFFGKIKGTTLAIYLIKITAEFTELRIISK